MTKSLAGAPLDLSDAPAKGSDLFLIDGNNLAYRAFFALPEDIATSYGQPTNALLGFANMLFKLLTDYRPRGVAVAWDTRPTERLEAATAAAVEYKAGRKPMPSILGAQFPHFRPIVEGFGYRNVAAPGWEADDVIATLATAADRAGLRTCVVSTDRDAFQLLTERTTLMMTPRGVASVEVYTPARLEARYGITPAQIPDFIGLKGDTADNIPGIPGIGEKTAAELLQKFGSLEGVLAHAGELTPAKRKTLEAHAEQGRHAKGLATMRRDLPLPITVEDLLGTPPDRSGLAAVLERFEFKNLKARLHLLD
ncbi:MAG: 5'-3' exonuclease H3TH domain-containing protein [Polyangiaceae bacterium]